MRNSKYKHVVYALAIFLLASVLCLWAWNTVGELFGLPHAEYRHALAALVLLMTVRIGLSGGRSHRLFSGGHHEHQAD